MEQGAHYLQMICDFINEVGIPCRQGPVPADSFLPGILISAGTVIFDTTQTLYPGDLLHEAGHLAVLTPNDRARADGGENISGDLAAPAAEMAAIAWSWAAKEHLGLPASVLFHQAGYKGGAQSLIDNFSAGKYLGVPILAWLGITREPRRDVSSGGPIYPQMEHWLRLK